MNASKRELREDWAQKVWPTLEFWMVRSRLSRRDFDVEALEEVVSKVRCIPTFKAYLKAMRRYSKKQPQKRQSRAAELFGTPPFMRIQANTLHIRRLMARWQRGTLSPTEPE